MWDTTLESTLPASTQPVPEFPKFTPGLEPSLIREQLNRLLTHTLFAHSKRYPVLLAYIVEQTLLGNAPSLKERTIGIEAFGRAPDYDVNIDPIVRTSAAEVRKRLIQYYYESSHVGQLVIELSAGSYVPAFREPDLPRIEASDPEGSAASLSSFQEPESIPDDASSRLAELPIASPQYSFTTQRDTRSRWILGAVLLLLSLGAGIAIGRHRPTPHLSEMEKFWEPITSSPGPVTYCIGEPGTAADLRRATAVVQNDPQTAARLSVSDVITLSRSIVPLVPRNSAFRVLSAQETSYAQLQEGPNVLIGAFSNIWTLRVTEKLRFGFEMKPGVLAIVDRKSSNAVSWNLQLDASRRNVVRDYAIVARIHDNLTGQPVIIIAGIMGSGTEAGGEVLYNSVYLDSLLQKAPKNWEQENLEAVIQTEVVDNHPGPPTILAVETW
jgi:hypothetical protein